MVVTIQWHNVVIFKVNIHSTKFVVQTLKWASEINVFKQRQKIENAFQFGQTNDILSIESLLHFLVCLRRGQDHQMGNCYDRTKPGFLLFIATNFPGHIKKKQCGNAENTREEEITKEGNSWSQKIATMARLGKNARYNVFYTIIQRVQIFSISRWGGLRGECELS